MSEFNATGGGKWTTAEYATAQTDTVLVAAPGAGLALQLVKWKFSSDTTLKITLEAGAALVDAQHASANGGQVVSFQGYANPKAGDVVQLPANTALTITTSGAGNVAVGVLTRTIEV